MLRWLKKNGSSKDGKPAATPDDDWAYLRSQPDFDAEEMADVHAPTAFAVPGPSSDWSDSSHLSDNGAAYGTAEPYFDAPAPPFKPAPASPAASRQAQESRPTFNAGDAAELPLTVSCGSSVLDECLQGSVLIGKLDLDREVFPEIDLSLDRDVSPRHAMILLRASGFVLKDVGSETGTFLNGRRLVLGEEAPLGPGDEIRLGAITSIVVPGGTVVQDDVSLSDEDLALAELALQASGAKPLPQPRFAVPPVAIAPEPPTRTGRMDLLDLALAPRDGFAPNGEDEEPVPALRRDLGASEYRTSEPHPFGDFERAVGVTARWSAPSDESACDR